MKFKLIVTSILILAVIITGCQNIEQENKTINNEHKVMNKTLDKNINTSMKLEKNILENATQEQVEKMKEENTNVIKNAVFAGGCFWCMEAAVEPIGGVIEATSGYIGGSEENAHYNIVASKKTKHLEAINVTYNSSVISYESLVKFFYRQIDPTDDGGQFVDRGPEYRTAIFYQTEEEKAIAEKVTAEVQTTLDKPIVTQILPIKPFYDAEEEHQDYYKKRALNYYFYKKGSGREKVLENIWGDEAGKNYNVSEEDEEEIDTSTNVWTKNMNMTDAEIKDKLTPLQYRVTQEKGTEPAFLNDYWNEKHEGIYVDIVSGEPLFSSTTKFSSGTGWPSFTAPINNDSIIENKDTSFEITRVEVRSETSHLGHVFDDGPDGKPRFCINSASLRFIPKEDMKKEGYKDYFYLFE